MAHFKHKLGEGLRELSIKADVTNISEQRVKFDDIEQNAYVVSVDPMIHFHSCTKPPELAPKVFHVMLNAGLLVGFLAGFVTLFVGGELFNQIITGGFAGAVVGVLMLAICRRIGDAGIAFCFTYIEFVAERLFKFYIFPRVFGVIYKLNSGTTVGAVIGAFVGLSLIARISNKIIAKSTFAICIALGALVGMASGMDGETALRDMSGAIIIVGSIAIVLKVFDITTFNTEVVGRAVRGITGRNDEISTAAFIGIFIGALFTYYHTTSIGILIVAVAEAISLRGSYGTFDNLCSNIFKGANSKQVIFFTTTSLLGLCPRYIISSTFTLGGILTAIAHNNTLIDMLHYWAGNRIVGAITRYTQRAIQISQAYVRTIDQSIVLGVVGAVYGSCFGITADLMARDMLVGATWGAILGAIAGVVSGMITAIATAVFWGIAFILTSISLTSARKSKTTVVIMISAISGLIGSILSGYFTSITMAVCLLIGLTFSLATAASLVAITYIARRYLTDRVYIAKVVSKFGTAIGHRDQNNWTQYRITKTTSV